MGLAQYTLRQYDEAEATFETARSLDPYRLTHMDTYSNILYVKVGTQTIDFGSLVWRDFFFFLLMVLKGEKG